MQNKKSISIIVTVSVLILGAIGALAAALFKDNPLQVKKENDNEGGTTQNSVYKNGDYQVTQTYPSPGGTEEFGLSVTLFNDVVISADFTVGAISPVGKNLQEKFSQDFKQYVVGKNMSEINLSVVSGASLTSAAFNQALAQLKEQAAS